MYIRLLCKLFILLWNIAHYDYYVMFHTVDIDVGYVHKNSCVEFSM